MTRAAPGWLDKARGTVLCAHCGSPRARSACPHCRRAVCRPCADADNCPEPRPRELRLGLGGRLRAVDERGRVGFAEFADSQRLVDLETGQQARLAPRYADSPVLLTGPCSLGAGRVVWPAGVVDAGRLCAGLLLATPRKLRLEELRFHALRRPLDRFAELLSDGRRVVAAGDSAFAVIDLATTRELVWRDLSPEVIHGCAVSETLGLIAVGHVGRAVLFRLADGLPIGAVRLGDVETTALCFGGRRLLLLDARRDLQLLECLPGAPPSSWPVVHRQPATCSGAVSVADASLSADGALLALRRRRVEVEVRALDSATRWRLRRHTDRVSLVRFTDGGRILVTADDDNRVVLWPRLGGDIAGASR